MQVNVRDNNIEQALRALKKKLQREGVFREMKLKQHFEKPSVKKAREKAEAVRRARKLARKKMIREGIKVISYFIDGKPDGRNANCFRNMYGKEAQFINVNKIGDVAKSMNNKFLEVV